MFKRFYLLLGSHTFLIVPLIFTSPAAAVQLLGRAILRADTFTPGPTSGQQISIPFTEQQPVQGFSAVLPGPKPGTFRVLADNGFGLKNNSADFLLRVYAVEPDFTTGQVFPVNFQTGERLTRFSQESFLQLNDRNNQIEFPIIAEQSLYPETTIPVDSKIQSNRWLTGADFDIESFRQASDGTYWFGDEFGPFLLHVSADGQVLDAPIPLPNFLGLGDNPLVQSPDNPQLDSTANLGGSNGFEGLALNSSGTKLYAMLEGALQPDDQRDRLLINEFDLATKKYTGKTFFYQRDPKGKAIGDLTAINDHEFLVIERDNRTGDPNNPEFPRPAEFKRIYKIDINQIDSDGFVQKELLVDLLNIPDPNNLGGNGTTDGVFTFPFVTIESVLPVDDKTLLVINDNNYPFSKGRSPDQPDNNEFILIQLDQSLNLAPSQATPVPEPMTILGSAVAFDFGILFNAKKRQ
ncbi:MAG: PEP-CTERM sorting domain-containing protein [Coleofasciculus chthonoplastes F3-SA18-01]|uniref:PEP-CTERM sorting domain-containing protein n=1 Tax=Coleofasciculus chthonoplastes TaxID=64178 RepID=UPI0032FFFBA5